LPVRGRREACARQPRRATIRRNIHNQTVGTRAALPRAVAALAPAYRPRRPTETVLYGMVRDHLESFLEYVRDSYEAPLPRYVEHDLRGNLRCGVFAHGFVHCRCQSCGHDLLVGFSCKGRGTCPSCAGRRMCDVAARLVDRVPSVPVRQWVLSLPFELRGLAAFRADVLSAFVRIFIEAVFARYRAHGRAQGISDPYPGAVTFVQRFGSSLNLNVHFHVCLLDGVFDRDAHGGLRFLGAAEPTRDEMESIVRRVHKRVAVWLARRDPRAAAPATAPLQACATIAMRRGNVSRTSATGESAAAPAAPDDQPPPERAAVDFERFNLNASVAIATDDDLRRERLLRYGARPPFALERLRTKSGGRIAYCVKKVALGAREKVRVMTSLEFLSRLSALIPPPRYPLVRYHGVLAPGSKWRRDVVPKPRESTFACVRTAKGAVKDVPARVEPSSGRERQPRGEPARLARRGFPAPKMGRKQNAGCRDALPHPPSFAAGVPRSGVRKQRR
jgi:Putative transposase/Transposase zinc-binding domain